MGQTRYTAAVGAADPDESMVWHCPNCGEICIGSITGEGECRAVCRHCKAVTVRERATRRSIRLITYASRTGVF